MYVVHSPYGKYIIYEHMDNGTSNLLWQRNSFAAWVIKYFNMINSILNFVDPFIDA